MYAGLIGTAVHVVLGPGIAIAACPPRTNLLRTAHEGENYFGRLQHLEGDREIRHHGCPVKYFVRDDNYLNIKYMDRVPRKNDLN